MPGNLRKEASARSDDNDIDSAELLNRRVRELRHSCNGFFRIALIVQGHKVVEILDFVPALGKPRGANHHLFSLGHDSGI